MKGYKIWPSRLWTSFFINIIIYLKAYNLHIWFSLLLITIYLLKGIRKPNLQSCRHPTALQKGRLIKNLCCKSCRLHMWQTVWIIYKFRKYFCDFKVGIALVCARPQWNFWTQLLSDFQFLYWIQTLLFIQPQSYKFKFLMHFHFFWDPCHPWC